MHLFEQFSAVEHVELNQDSNVLKDGFKWSCWQQRPFWRRSFCIWALWRPFNSTYGPFKLHVLTGLRFQLKTITLACSSMCAHSSSERHVYETHWNVEAIATLPLSVRTTWASRVISVKNVFNEGNHLECGWRWTCFENQQPFRILWTGLGCVKSGRNVSDF